MKLLKLLCPNQQVASILEVDVRFLQSIGVRALLLDLDNTIVEYKKSVLRPEFYDYLQSALRQDMKLCLLSNNYTKRVSAIAECIGIPFVPRAAKPWSSGFRNACRLLNIDPEHTAIIGDQLFTDVLGGNRLGLYTIWVPPLSSQEFFGTKLSRLLEGAVVSLVHRKDSGYDRGINRHE